MELNITNSDICMVCPSGTTPDMNLVDSLGRFFSDAASSLVPLVGRELLESVSGSSSLADTAKDPREKLWQWCLCYIIVKGYHDAIPHLDLVLTPTGFGVVSNQNVAPASSDRVERLRAALSRQSDFYFVEILSHLRSITEWHEFKSSYRITSFFWDYRNLKLLGVPNPCLDDMASHLADISAGEAMCRQLLGREFWGELLSAEAHDTLTDAQATVVRLIRNFVAAAVAGGPRLEMHRKVLLDYIHHDIHLFKTYEDSSACAANTFRPYENGKDDSCFFFG